jgi:hypothetical protein
MLLLLVFYQFYIFLGKDVTDFCFLTIFAIFWFCELSYMGACWYLVVVAHRISLEYMLFVP